MLETARFLSSLGFIRPGVIDRVTVQPAAGAEWTAVVPGGQIWRVLGANASFTTSAAVGNRLVGVDITAQGILMWETMNASVFAAGFGPALLVYMVMPTLTPVDANTFVFQIPMREYLLRPGDTFASRTRGILAGDQYTNVQLLVERFYFTDQELSEMAEERYERMMVGTG